MNKSKKILLSGIQPSGILHIGNYFGAMKQFILLQEEYDTYVSIVNYHALTSIPEPRALAEDTQNAILDHLAIGLKPENLFLQSDIPEVTELAWILNNLITVLCLSRAVADKEKVEKGAEATVGLFDYPVLMAADILIMDANVVPVGQDQKQHVEIARDIAQKFNSRYGELFVVPDARILKEVAVIPGIDNAKMSKSYENTIPLFATDDEIEKLVMRIVTDSKGEKDEKDPDKDIVFALHTLFSVDEIDELKERYKLGKIGYRESKEILIKNIQTFVAPLREKREKIARENKDILEVIQSGRKRAQKRAHEKMEKVREAVGVQF